MASPASVVYPAPMSTPPVEPAWTARRILKELVDADRRRDILADFWRFADAPTRLAAQAYLARALNFRAVSIGKMPPERKAELLASRLGGAESEQFVETALMQYHMHRAGPLMAAFLDRWGIAHTDGEIADPDAAAPAIADVRAATAALAGAFDRRDVRLYLAAAGLLMGEDWRQATWPVVDELASP
jgi:hypothetical protein